ncbi:hypothetical protein NMY22_g7707 [Coprinellus aureogranulatus]|nr:hypothetical protein NMY22_g7707 [Coprinellus aureogranulatus]
MPARYMNRSELFCGFFHQASSEGCQEVGMRAQLVGHCQWCVGALTTDSTCPRGHRIARFMSLESVIFRREQYRSASFGYIDPSQRSHAISLRRNLDVPEVTKVHAHRGSTGTHTAQGTLDPPSLSKFNFHVKPTAVHSSDTHTPTLFKAGDRQPPLSQSGFSRLPSGRSLSLCVAFSRAEESLAVASPEEMALDPAIQEMYMRYYLVAFWLERHTSNATASRIFLFSIISMFLIITFHNFLNVYRLVAAYAWAEDPVGFIRDWGKWDALAFPVTNAIVTWIGDVLVIYRCYLIWQRSYWVISLPVFLLVVSFGTSFFAFYWFRHQSSFPPWAINVLKVPFPLNFVQNALTTSFIAYKIYGCHRLSQRSGLYARASIDLITVLRIVLESALIYTVVMFVAAVLVFVNHPSQVIVQHTVGPITGIVFALIAVRTHMARSASDVTGMLRFPNESTMLATWLSGEDHPGALRTTRRMGPPVTTTAQEYRMSVQPGGKDDGETNS